MPIYKLVNAEERASEHADFHIPLKEDRDELVPGQFAKLIFEYYDKHEKTMYGERMWVRISFVKEPGKYVGTLMNKPHPRFGVKRGSTIRLESKNIIAVMSSEGSKQIDEVAPIAIQSNNPYPE